MWLFKLRWKIKFLSGSSHISGSFTIYDSYMPQNRIECCDYHRQLYLPAQLYVWPDLFYFGLNMSQWGYEFPSRGTECSFIFFCDVRSWSSGPKYFRWLHIAKQWYFSSALHLLADIFLSFTFFVLGFEPRTLYMLRACSPTEPHL